MTSALVSFTQPNAMPILRDTKHRRCSKVFLEDGTVEPYPRVMRWRPQAVAITGFDHFARALQAAAKLGDAVVIRGSIPDGTHIPEGGVYRRMVGAGLPDALWSPTPRQWLAVDCDGVDGDSDPLAPWDELRALLPDFLREHSFVGQLTSSAGIAPGLRARLWFWLDQPVSDGKLRAFDWPAALKADVAIYNAVQPHYLAAPEFKERADPAPMRWTICAGIAGDVVDASALLSVAEPPAVEALPVCDLPPGNKQEIAQRIDRIRRSVTTGSRHHHGLGVACELIAVGCPPEVVEAEVEDLIRRQGRQPTMGEGASLVRAAIQKQLAGTMTISSPPVALVLAKADEAEAEAVASPEPEEVVTGDDVVGDSAPGMSMYGANDWLNAGMYRRDCHPDGGFIRWGQQDWEWTGRHWQRLENDEVLLQRVQRHTNLKHQRATACAKSFRSLMGREKLNPPCMLDGTKLPHMLSFNNGVLDVDAWMMEPGIDLLPHDPARFLTCSLPYDYVAGAKAPRFHRFLDSVWPDQPDQRREFQKMLGYLLLHDNRFHKLFVILGAPRSGKGTMLRLIKQLVGSDNCCSPNLSSLANDFGLHVLLGRSVATIGEANAQGKLPDIAIDRIKSISGGDDVPVNRKGKDELHLHLPVRFVIACNRLPGFLDPSGALAARMVLLTMWNSFVGKEDIDLGRALEAELPGIAQFALEGLRLLLVDDGGFTATASTRKTAEEFRTMQAPTATFLSQCVEEGKPSDWLPLRDLYEAYKAWCVEHGHLPTSAARLGAELSYQYPGPASASTTRRTGSGTVRGRERSHFRLTAEGRAYLNTAAAAGFDDAPP